MRITLISDVLPDNAYTAGQVLRKTLERLQCERIEVIWINQSRLGRPQGPDPLFHIAREYTFSLPTQAGQFFHQLISRLGPTSRPSLLVQALLTAYFCFKIAFSILLARRTSGCKSDYLWFSLQGEKLLLIYSILSLFESTPIVLQQWDPLSWWMGNRGYRVRLIDIMSSVLARLQRSVFLNIVPSTPWEAKLRTEGFSVARLDNFLVAEDVPSLPAFKLDSNHAINAVFVGQLYANDELRSCVSLVARDASALGCNLVVHYFGAGKPLSMPHVEFVSYGYRERSEVIAMISKWDLALLPYPTDPKYAEAARLSFPSKARLYLAAGLPIIAYAPQESSVHTFFSEHYQAFYTNAYVNKHVDWFLRLCKEAAIESVRQRRRFAHELVATWFSEEAELKPLAIRLSRALLVRNGRHTN